MWSLYRRQIAVAASFECATIKFGYPNALAFSRKLLTCLWVAGALGEGNSGRSPESQKQYKSYLLVFFGLKIPRLVM